MDGCAVKNVLSLFDFFLENTEKTLSGAGCLSEEGGGGRSDKKNCRKKRLARDLIKSDFCVAKTYPGGSVCDAVIWIARRLHFTSVHSQKITSLQENKNTHTSDVIY